MSKGVLIAGFLALVVVLGVVLFGLSGDEGVSADIDEEDGQYNLFEWDG